MGCKQGNRIKRIQLTDSEVFLLFMGQTGVQHTTASWSLKSKRVLYHSAGQEWLWGHRHCRSSGQTFVSGFYFVILLLLRFRCLSLGVASLLFVQGPSRTTTTKKKITVCWQSKVPFSYIRKQQNKKKKARRLNSWEREEVQTLCITMLFDSTKQILKAKLAA